MSKLTVTRERDPDRVNASFEERSAWIQLLSLLVVLGGYFLVAWQMASRGVTALPAYASVFAVAVALLVAVMVAGYVAVALASRPEGPDERDRLIEWRAEARSGWVLGAGVLAAIAAMVVSVPDVWVAHLLLLSLFLSELLKLVLQLVDYRRGLQA